jgi:hypothetical protein
LQPEGRLESELRRLPIGGVHGSLRHQLERIGVVRRQGDRPTDELERGCRIPLLEQAVGAEDQVRHRVTVVQSLGADTGTVRKSDAVRLVISAEKAEDLDLQRDQASVPGVRRNQPVDIGEGTLEVGPLVRPIGDAGNGGLEIGRRCAASRGSLKCAAAGAIDEVEKILAVIGIIEGKARVLDERGPEVGPDLSFVA